MVRGMPQKVAPAFTLPLRLLNFNMRFERYIFICINQRPGGHPRGCCADKGSVQIHAEFKKLLGEHRVRTKIRANKAGCMELCEIGPAVLVHPDNVWYQKVTLEDVPEIVESHILGGKPVERLLADFSTYGK